MEKRSSITKKVATLAIAIIGIAIVGLLIFFASKYAGKDKDVVVTLNQRDVAIEVDEKISLKAECQVEGKKVDSKDIEWVSKKSTVVAVDKDGDVTGLKGGTGYITAVFEHEGKEYSATCVVTVKDEELEYSTYKLRWHVQNKDRDGYEVTEEIFEREVGSKVELTLQEASAKLSSGYVLNKEKSNLKGTVKNKLGACVIDVVYDVAKVKYNVNYYMESNKVLGTYVKETEKLEAYAFEPVSVVPAEKAGFTFNKAAKNVVTTKSLTPGMNFSLYYNRLRTNVTIKYISGKTATYQNVYGVGLLGAPVLTENMGYFTSTGYVDGKQVNMNNSYFKTLLADTTVQIGVSGNGFTYSPANGGTLTHTNDEIGSHSYAYTGKKGDTIYLKGTYETTGSLTDSFGITLTDGKNSWQARMRKYDLIVSKDGNSGTINWGSDSVDSIYVRTSVAKQNAYDMTWALWEGTLYCNINGQIVGAIPMKQIDSSWKAGKQYEIGISALDYEGMEDALKVKNLDIQVGNAALAKLVTDKKVASTEASALNYEPINGTYVPANRGQAGYMYAPVTDVNVGISATIKWFSKDTSVAAAGITVKVGDESRQIVVEGMNSQVRRQEAHKWQNVVWMNDRVTRYVKPFDTTGTSKVVAAVRDGHLYITYNGVQAACIKMAALFPEYQKDTKATLGIYTWDARLGLSEFSDVKVLNANQVAALSLQEFGYYSEAGYASQQDYKTGLIKKTAAGWQEVELLGTSDKWQVTGTMKRYDARNAGDLMMGFHIASGDKKVQILGQHYGFARIVNGQWTNVYTNNGGNTKYAFNDVTYPFFRSDSRRADQLEFKAVIWEDVLYVWFNGEICWRVPLTDPEFGGFEAGSKYVLKLSMADTPRQGGFENIKTKMSYEVADIAGLEDNLKTITNNVTRWALGNMTNFHIDGVNGEELTTISMTQYGTYAYLEETSTDIYLSAKYHTLKKRATTFMGITIKNGDQTRQIGFQHKGITVQAQHGWAPNGGTGVPGVGDNVFYYNTAGNNGNYVFAQNIAGAWGKTENNPIYNMVSSTTPSVYQIDWAITDGVLYGRIEGDLFLQMPLTKLCSTWTADKEYQIGFNTWGNSPNGDIKVTDITANYGDAAKAKLVTDKKVDFASSKDMAYEAFTGAYVPRSATGSHYAYGAASKKAQGISTTITMVDKANTGSSSGIGIKSGNQSAEIRTEGHNLAVRIQFNNDWGTPTTVTNQLPTDVKPYDANGVCKMTAVIKNDMIYIFYNGKQAGALELYKLLPGYKTGDEIQMGITGWDTSNGLSLFHDTKFLTEEEAKAVVTNDVKWDVEFFTQATTNATVDVVNGTITKDPNNTTSLRFVGESATWEITGKMKRTDARTTANMLQGFDIWVGSTQLRVLGQHKGICFPWNYTHNQGTSAYAFNPAIYDFFGSPRTKDEVTFKMVIANDTMYVWFDGVPSWKVPLASKLTQPNSETVIFNGFAAGSKYNVGVEMLDGGRQGGFSDLKVKTGSAVDTACLSEFAGK